MQTHSDVKVCAKQFKWKKRQKKHMVVEVVEVTHPLHSKLALLFRCWDQKLHARPVNECLTAWLEPSSRISSILWRVVGTKPWLMKSALTALIGRLQSKKHQHSTKCIKSKKKRKMWIKVIQASVNIQCAGQCLCGPNEKTEKTLEKVSWASHLIHWLCCACCSVVAVICVCSSGLCSNFSSTVGKRCKLFHPGHLSKRFGTECRKTDEP